MNPKFTLYFGKTRACDVDLQPVDKPIALSSDIGEVTVQPHEVLSFTMFKHLFSTIGLPRGGAMNDGTDTNVPWGFADYDGLLYVFKRFPKPWSYQIEHAPIPQPFTIDPSDMTH